MEDFDGFPNFQGFNAPQTTQVPDVLIDKIMPKLGEGELKTLLYIVRRTYGFGKTSDQISLSQMLTGIVKSDGKPLDHGTGLSKKSLLKALASLKEKNLILAERQYSDERGHEPTLYRLRMQDESTPPLGNKGIQGDGKATPPRARGSKSPIQDPVIQYNPNTGTRGRRKKSDPTTPEKFLDQGPFSHLVKH